MYLHSVSILTIICIAGGANAFYGVGRSSGVASDLAACTSADGLVDEASLLQTRFDHIFGSPTGCGLPTSKTECPRDYSLASVNETVEQRRASPEAGRKALQKVHDEMRQACAVSSGKADTVLPDGGWCYDKNHSFLVKASDGKSDVDYYLPVHHVAADEIYVSVLAEQVLPREDGSCCQSITDLGAGIGQLGHALRAKFPTLEYHGYDGAGNVEEFTDNYVAFTDLTRPLSLKQTDWVFSSEVGEHIPNENEAQVIANIHAHNCKGIILSWAIVGQGGHGHVNVHSNEYMIKLFEGLGYKKNEHLTAALRAPRVGPDHPWLMGSSMAFDRLSKPSTCP